MAFPTIPTGGRVISGFQTGTTPTRTFPNLNTLTSPAGELIVALVFGYQTGTGTNAAFSGWTGGFTEFGDFASTTTLAIGAAWKISNGAETGTFAVTQATVITGDAAFIVMSIPAGGNIVAGGAATGVSSTANSGSLTTGFGAVDTLWITVAGCGEDATTGSFTGLAATNPTNYSNTVASTISQDVVGGLNAAVSFRQLNAASEDPAALSSDTSNARWTAITLGVRTPTTPGVGIVSAVALPTDFDYAPAGVGIVGVTAPNAPPPTPPVSGSPPHGFVAHRRYTGALWGGVGVDNPPQVYAGVATVSAVSVAPPVAETASSGVATVSAVASQPTSAVKANADVAIAGAVSNSATVTSGAFANAPAGVAIVSAVSNRPATAITDSAGVATVSAVSASPTVTIAPNAGVAVSLALAAGPTVQGTSQPAGSPPAGYVSRRMRAMPVWGGILAPFLVVQSTNAPAGAAQVSVTAPNAIAADGVNARVAVVGAAAVQPAVSTIPQVSAPAGVATVSAAASPPIVTVAPNAGVAIAGASATPVSMASTRTIGVASASATASGIAGTPRVIGTAGANIVSPLTTSAATVAGDAIFVVFGNSAGGQGAGSVTDSAGNTYVLLPGSALASGSYLFAATYKGSPGTPTAALPAGGTISFSGTANVVAAAVTGAQTLGYDRSPAATSATSASESQTFPAQLRNGEIVIAASNFAGTGQSITWTAPLAKIADSLVNGNNLSMAYAIQPAGSNGSLSLAATLGVSAFWDLMSASFLADSAISANANAAPAVVSAAAMNPAVTTSGSVNAPAGVATVSVSAPSATIAEGISSGAAAVSAVASQPVPAITVTAGVAIAGSVALQAVASISGTTNAPAGVATVSVTAPNALIAEGISSGVAVVNAAASPSASSVSASAGVATVQSVAPGASVAEGINARVATVAAAGSNPSVAETFSAGVAVVGVQASSVLQAVATVTTVATVSSQAVSPTVAETVNAGVAIAGVQAVSPQVSISGQTNAHPGAGSVSAVSLNASIAESSSAGVAPAQVLATAPTPAVSAQAGVAVVSAAAVQPTVSTIPQASPSAGVAVVGVTAPNASVPQGNASAAIVGAQASQPATAVTVRAGVAAVACTALPVTMAASRAIGVATVATSVPLASFTVRATTVAAVILAQVVNPATHGDVPNVAAKSAPTVASRAASTPSVYNVGNSDGTGVPPWLPSSSVTDPSDGRSEVT